MERRLMAAHIRVCDIDDILPQPVAEISGGLSANLQQPVEKKRVSL